MTGLLDTDTGSPPYWHQIGIILERDPPMTLTPRSGSRDPALDPHAIGTHVAPIVRNPLMLGER